MSQFLGPSHHDAGVLAVPGVLPVAAVPRRGGDACAHDVHHSHDQREVPRTSARLAGELIAALPNARWQNIPLII